MLRRAQDLSIAFGQQGAPEVMTKLEGVTRPSRRERLPKQICVAKCEFLLCLRTSKNFRNSCNGAWLNSANY